MRCARKREFTFRSRPASPKPSVIAGFKLPFAVDVVEHPDGTKETLLFGQVRPGKKPHHVAIERWHGWGAAAEQD